MRQSFLLWVPSLQRNVRFGEFVTEHQLHIAKASGLDTTGTDAEFVFALNSTLRQLCTENDIETGKLTVVDKFVIVLQLLIQCSATSQKMRFVCPQCGSNVKTTVDFRDYLEKVAPVLDADLRRVVHCDGLDITCNIPTVDYEYEMLAAQVDGSGYGGDRVDAYYDGAIMSYVCELQFDGGRLFDMAALPIPQRRKVLQQLPAVAHREIHEQFTKQVSDAIHPVALDKAVCICGYESQMHFSFDSANPILKTFLDVWSPAHIYQDVYDFATKLAIPPHQTHQLTPGEREVFKQMYMADQARSQGGGDDSQEQQDGFDDDGAVEPAPITPAPLRLTPPHMQPSGPSSFGENSLSTV